MQAAVSMQTLRERKTMGRRLLEHRYQCLCCVYCGPYSSRLRVSGRHWRHLDLAQMGAEAGWTSF